ncbi:hypothetical protein ZIOFF_033206 [Zingiber officinale]|uniref:Uncharacterized protein n=1 Tax=Zingiber officinale TaxID=94328 RepID=A0A8J5GWP9_ZINOF|nr:hypothetical protein ZIOFF_033206 [Zingiber officinale]
MDDVLDMTRTSEDLGKMAGNDLVKEKTMYLKLMGLEKVQLLAEKLVAKVEENCRVSIGTERGCCATSSTTSPTATTLLYFSHT